MPEVLAGAHAWSSVGTSGGGLLAVHGFTGSPASMRAVAERAAAEGMHVELPRLPGHGTTVDDMVATRWVDWTRAVDAALDALLARVERVVVAGLSMGGALALDLALRRSDDVAALALVNPVTRPQDGDVVEMLRELLDDGVTAVPSPGSDVADPEAEDVGYDATPIAPLLSLIVDGVAPMAERYGELDVPLRLFTSRHDHVVDPADSEHLAATHGGPVEHTWLERGYHVATIDLDRDLVIDGTVAFARRIALEGVAP